MGDLTVLGIKAIKAGPKRTRHSDGDNLYLVVDATSPSRPAGARRWLFIYRYGDAQKEIGLGGLDKVPLVTARAKAAEYREMLGRGIDPQVAKKAKLAAPTVPTFSAFAEEYIKSQEPGWKGKKTAPGWRNTMNRHAALLGPLPVDQITTDDVLAVLRPIWNTMAETAQKTQMRLETILDAAKAQRLRTGENPARWRGHLKLLLTPRRTLVRGSHAALPYEDLPDFMVDLALREGAGARGLELLILTASREAMICGAVWSEFDLASTLWSIPAMRMKGDLNAATDDDFVVPLSTQAVALLHKALPASGEAPKPTDYVFPGSRAGTQMSNATMDAVLDRMNVGAVPHGFRSCFTDWAGEETDHPDAIVEMALNHKVGSKVRRVYRRRDALRKRTLLMQDWANYAMSKVVVTDAVAV